ncbi:SRPBCC family protein [Streptomyces sp. WZ-12]|uniref:SRPBCC family protein n=1 Tax=Streptomyces sp. WZ-12 TaxID=3030210 RepID=UPI002380D02E|nr:SRPBCC family protein [Streptomyces sp. WZ-12]
MAGFRIARSAPLSPEVAWRRLTRWEAHAARVPLTTITVTTPPPVGLGTIFVARTGLGPLAFDDVMRVVVWEPPGRSGGGAAGRCRVEKRGRLVSGRSTIEVAPRDEGCRVAWSGEIRLRALPGVSFPVPAWLARWLYGRIVQGLLER